MSRRAVTFLPLALPLLLTAALACQRDSGSSKGGSSGQMGAAADPNAPTLEMFVMSQCPYGIQAVNAVAEAKAQLGSGLRVKVGYIGDGKSGSLTSMHGPNEIKGDLAQVCAMKQAPDKYLAMVVCQNKDPKAIGDNWKDCAKQVGIDADALAKCAEGADGQKLLAAAFEEASKRGATGSPTMFLDGKPYEGGRKPRDFQRAICAATKGSKPAACQNIPQPPTVHAVFLSDTRCKDCDIRKLEPRLKGALGGLVVEHVDYSSAKGKELYKELAAAGPPFKFLPAILLGPEVEKDADGYGELQRFLRPVGQWRALMLGGSFDPAAEICDNGGTDDDADGKSDCADPDCTGNLACRPDKPKTLDLFVMSHCPYGAKAMIAAKEFVDHFGKEVALNVHFIGDEKDGQLQSMHGPDEVDEDVREVCASSIYGKNHQFLKYLACRSKDYKSTEWHPCATEAGMDAAKIQACFDGNGKKLLTASFAESKQLGIDASPTWMANNKRMFNAIAANEIQTQYCQDNPAVAACKNPIAAAEPAPGGAAAGQAAQGGQCN